MNTKTTAATPGPWTTDYLDQNKLDGNAPCRIRAQNRTVAWVDFWQDESYATQVQIEEQKANARLIAAAPELLEVLTEMVEMIDRGDEPGNGSHWHVKAKAALALAQGGGL